MNQESANALSARWIRGLRDGEWPWAVAETRETRDEARHVVDQCLQQLVPDAEYSVVDDTAAVPLVYALCGDVIYEIGCGDIVVEGRRVEATSRLRCIPVVRERVRVTAESTFDSNWNANDRTTRWVFEIDEDTTIKFVSSPRSVPGTEAFAHALADRLGMRVPEEVPA